MDNFIFIGEEKKKAEEEVKLATDEQHKIENANQETV